MDINGNPLTPATDAKLEQVRSLLSGVATEEKLEQARALLETISGKDFAKDDTLAQVKTELENIKAEIEAIKASQTMRGLLADRPAPNAAGIIPGKTLFWAVDEGWVYASDAATWHRVVEVGA